MQYLYLRRGYAINNQMDFLVFRGIQTIIKTIKKQRILEWRCWKCDWCHFGFRLSWYWIHWFSIRCPRIILVIQIMHICV